MKATVTTLAAEYHRADGDFNHAVQNNTCDGSQSRTMEKVRAQLARRKPKSIADAAKLLRVAAHDLGYTSLKHSPRTLRRLATELTRCGRISWAELHFRCLDFNLSQDPEFADARRIVRSVEKFIVGA
jgi:hypothetical protein